MKHKIKMTPLKSSNIAAAGFDAATNTLAIEFSNGSKYRYKDVPAETAQALLSAESVGRFFAQNIRGKFSCVPVGEEV